MIEYTALAWNNIGTRLTCFQLCDGPRTAPPPNGQNYPLLCDQSSLAFTEPGTSLLSVQINNVEMLLIFNTKLYVLFFIEILNNKQTNKQTPWPLVRERTIPTDQPPLVDEI
jgi:hypothetical protein